MNLAQCNLGWVRYPLEDSRMREFLEAVTEINQLADEASGFIWRYQEPNGHAMGVRVWDDPRILYNCSTWESVEALWRYAFKTEHTEFYRRRREWFTVPPIPPAVMWWVEEGVEPAVEEGLNKLMQLRIDGDTADHFTFRWAMDADGKPLPKDWKRRSSN